MPEIRNDDEVSITIRKSGPPPEDDVEDGVYPLVLVDIKVKNVPTERHPDGQDMWVWEFALDDEAGSKIVTAMSSQATSPKSKAYGFLTALMGAVPSTDDTFRLRNLVGRRAQGEIEHNDNGYPRVKSLMAMPRSAPRSQNVVAQAAEQRAEETAIVPPPATVSVQPQGPIGPGALTPQQVPAPAAAPPPADDLGF